MTKPRYLLYDTLDDRREIHYLLRKLSPQRRVAFLEWACTTATLANSTVKPKVSPKTRQLAEVARWDSSADERLSLEVFRDVWYLCNQYKFDIDNALLKLTEIVSVSPFSMALPS